MTMQRKSNGRGRRRGRTRAASVLAKVGATGLVLLWAGCSASSEAPSGNFSFAGATNSSSGGALSNGPGSGGGSGMPPLPPEQETEQSFNLPVQSGRFIWSANPESGNVAVIDSRTLGVRLAAAGFGPTYLAALPPAGDVLGAALVLNRFGRDAAVLRLREEGLEVRRVPTHPDANAWSVSPDGRFAVAWSDAALVKDSDSADSFQDVTVLDVSGSEPTATRLSVGYRPSRIFFDDQSSRAFVVSIAGLTTIELSGDAPRVVRDVVLSDVAGEVASDVSVLPSGSHALFRVEGQAFVGVVDLSSGERSRIVLSGPVTDLDLVADGTAAIAVVRGRLVPALGTGGMGGAAGTDAENQGGSSGSAPEETGGDSGGANPVAGAAGAEGGTPAPATEWAPSEVTVLRVPEILEDTAQLERVEVEDLVGSVAVSADGSRAVLYTTATPLDRVVVLDTALGTAGFLSNRRVTVRAPVQSVFVSPDATHALISLRVNEASVKGAFGIVPLYDALPVKIQTTDAPITGVAFGASPTRSAILTAATGRTAYLTQLPALRVDSVPLPSLPLSAGILAEENVGYVAQAHPDGRLSLINLETAEPRTLTGFELGKGVSDGN